MCSIRIERVGVRNEGSQRYEDPLEIGPAQACAVLGQPLQAVRHVFQRNTGPAPTRPTNDRLAPRHSGFEALDGGDAVDRPVERGDPTHAGGLGARHQVRLREVDTIHLVDLDRPEQ